jgi:peroxiredoxin Q/BCP
MDPKLLSVELPNVGEGPDPVSLNALVDADFLVLLLMQSHRSGTCRQQAREFVDRYEDFRELNAEIVTIVPGSRPQVRSWRRLVEPTFPVLADDETVFGEAFGQPRQYGLVGRLVDSFGRMPVTVVLDCRGEDVSVRSVYEGESSLDRPSVQGLLDTIAR